MKTKLKELLNNILKLLAKAMVWRYRPGIVGVTGSVGKTSAKHAIAAVLGSERHVRESRGNFNNETGLSLTILGDWKDSELKLFSREYGPGENTLRKAWFMLKVFAVATWKLIFKGTYPELIILEYGVDKPGDMKYLLEIAKPNIGVVTAVGEIPAHVEFFAGPEFVAREKSRLIEYLPAAGFAVLNYDDQTVMDMRERTRARTITFGFGEGADIRITNFENKFELGKFCGIAFKIEYAGSVVPVRLENVFGKAQAYAAASGACAGLIFGINLVKIAEALRGYKPASHRMNLISGIKETWILDDSYNASPMSMHAALDTLKSLKAKRKIVVLGDMLEIGKYTIEAHEAVGKLAAKSADIIVTVGARAKFIADAARKKKTIKKNIISFDTADDARIPVQELLKKGDLVLVKASHAMELEKVVEEIRLPEELK